MSYRIQHRETKLWMVWNKEMKTEEWQTEKEGSTPIKNKETAVALAQKLGLRHQDYLITSQ